MSLAEISREQRRLAYRAPATALATNMHLYWTGVAADMRKAGDSSLEWILEETPAGEVLRPVTARRATTCPSSSPPRRPSAPTAAIASGSQDLREPHAHVDAPRDSRDGRHRPARPADHPRFLPRDAKGYAIKETWTRSDAGDPQRRHESSTAPSLPDRYIARRLPAGTADLFVLSIFAWAEATFANISSGSRSAPETWRRPAPGSARRSPSRGRWPITRRSSTASPRLQLALRGGGSSGGPDRRRLVESVDTAQRGR